MGLWIGMSDKWGSTWEQNAPLAVLCVGEILANLALMFFALNVASHFWRKTKETPLLFTLLMGISLAVLALDYILSLAFFNGDQVPGRGLARQAIACAIWIPYFRVSKRVRNTFVR